MLGNVWQRHFTWLVLGVILFGLAAGAALAGLTQPSLTRNAQAQTGLPASGAAGSAGAASASPVTGARESNAAGGNASGGTGVVGTVAAVDSTTLTVRGPQGDVKVKLAGAKIVKTTEGSTDDLKVGQRVTAFAQQETDGSYTAASIQVSPADLPVRGAGIPFQGGGSGNAARGQGQQGGDSTVAAAIWHHLFGGCGHPDGGHQPGRCEAEGDRSKGSEGRGGSCCRPPVWAESVDFGKSGRGW